ncbi:MAG TPA: antibiotic biosynthesis monooxygenase [Cytophagaceae bacterium]
MAFINNENNNEINSGSADKVKLALLVTLEAKPGKEAEVEAFLRNGLPIVLNEKQTITWYALRIGKSTYGIFDTFYDEEGRNLHLSGKVAEALMAKAPELFSTAPDIKKVEILTSKLPK